jgi:hypothetical protein
MDEAGDGFEELCFCLESCSAPLCADVHRTEGTVARKSTLNIYTRNLYNAAPFSSSAATTGYTKKLISHVLALSKSEENRSLAGKGKKNDPPNRVCNTRHCAHLLSSQNWNILPNRFHLLSSQNDALLENAWSRN